MSAPGKIINVMSEIETNGEIEINGQLFPIGSFPFSWSKGYTQTGKLHDMNLSGILIQLIIENTFEISIILLYLLRKETIRYYILSPLHSLIDEWYGVKMI